MPTSQLLLLRHGQSTWNEERRWQGWADTPLTDLGEQQARDAALHLREVGLTRAVASDLQRARRTAELLAGFLGLGDVVTEPALRERHVGMVTGLVMDEIRARWPECFDPETNQLVSVPDGESDDELCARAIPALVDLGARFPSEKLLVISHGGVIRAIERRLGIEPPPSTPNLGGRWFDVEAGQLVGGQARLPVDPEFASSPPTE